MLNLSCSLLNLNVDSRCGDMIGEFPLLVLASDMFTDANGGRPAVVGVGGLP